MKYTLIKILSFFLIISLYTLSYAQEPEYKVPFQQTVIPVSAPAFSKTKHYQITDLPNLKPDTIHQIVARRISNYFTESHYRKFLLDGAFSTRILNRYLKQLDFNKSLFTQADINHFYLKSTVFADELKSGNLPFVYEIYNANLYKRFQRYQYALNLLQQPMNFSDKETLDFNREDIPWAKSEKDLDDYWRKRVKFDELNLALTGKKEKEIRTILTKRYNQVLKTLVQTNNEDVFQSFMNAFAKEIDPHTSYLAPQRKHEFDSDMSLSFEGIGATLTMEDDYTVISSFVKGGPAEKSHKIAIGDKIVGVGQINKPIEDIIGWRLDDIVDLIRGPKDTSVRLEILATGKNAKSRIITLKRDKIRLEDREVKGTIRKTARGNVGILDIPSFYIGLTAKVKRLLNDFNRQEVGSIVIDLRSNGGGSLAEVISLTELFIPGGPVVQVRDNMHNVIPYGGQEHMTVYSRPIVILTDRYSASASEIFAAALQDYGRAVIVGDTTFGKGTVQTSRNIAYPLDAKIHPDWPELGAVQYTIQKFYRINGGSTQIRGVQPDIKMTHAHLNYDIGERYLDNALPWDNIGSLSYQRVGNAEAILPILRSAHEKRIRNNPEFNYIEQDIQKVNQQKKTQYKISLNESVRAKQQKKEEAFELKRANERLKRMGKALITDINKLPKDFKVPDAFLDESIEIALDLKNYYINR